MALLICPECGNHVSDKATACLNCGYPISEILAMKEAEEKEKADREKEQKQQARAKRIKAVGVIGVICTVLAIVIVIACQPDKSGLFNGIKWNSPLKIVESKYPDGSEKAGDEEGETSYSVFIEEYESIEGLSALAIFYFKDDSLYEVSLVVLSDDDVLPYYKAVQQIKHRFDELYGDSLGSGSTIYWETSKSTVSLWNYNSLISVTYRDINYSE